MPRLRFAAALFPAVALSTALLLSMGASACRGRARGSAAVESAVTEALRERIAQASGGGLCVGSDLVQALSAVREFYEKRGFRPAWSSGGIVGRAADGLRRALGRAPEQGLSRSDYHVERIEAGLDAAGSWRRDGAEEVSSLAGLDLLLTDAFLLYASHLADGKVGHESLTFRPRWDDPRAPEDAVRLLADALERGEVGAPLAALEPGHAYYRGLAAALAFYRAVEARGGWPSLAPGPAVKPGGRDRRVPTLRRRLAAEGYAPSGSRAGGDLLNPGLAAALCSFQGRHGLPATGALDEPTREALNATPAQKIRRIAVNLERWRWLDRDLGPAYAFVDAAIYEMFVVDGGREVLRMKIVSGTPEWPTPIFSSRMTDIVLNPTWIAPPRILLRELIEYVKSDPEYLSRNKMALVRGWGAEAVEVDPRSIDFADLRAETLDFYLRQAPGPLNLLGRMKFTNPNPYNVFLHDTPYQSDFGLAQRAASHGCIRIERPVDFALFLLDGQPGWTAERIREAIDGLEERSVPVRRPVRVHVFYATAWPLHDGSVEFRQDLYGQDPRIAAALDAPSPRAPRD